MSKAEELDGKRAGVIAAEKFAVELDALKEAAARLEARCLDENPYVYSSCVSLALHAVGTQMSKVYAAVFAWGEENPNGSNHLHGSSAVRDSCLGDPCLDHEALLRDVAACGALEPARYRLFMEEKRAGTLH